MAREADFELPQPGFHEPSFGEGDPTPDPPGFSASHHSDTALYAQIWVLVRKDVVTVPESRITTNEMFGLGEAYGNRRWNPAMAKR